MSMHKEIIAAVAKSEGLTQAAVKGVLNAYHAGIMAALMGGETIRVRGFGTFSVKTMKAICRKGGCLGPINVPERQKVRFKAAFNV
jgi:nucleoid DNA-binding protein